MGVLAFLIWIFGLLMVVFWVVGDDLVVGGDSCGRTFISAPNQVLFTLGWARIDLRPTCTNLLNPTSRRDASYPCLISLWPKEGCTVMRVITYTMVHSVFVSCIIIL